MTERLPWFDRKFTLGLPTGLLPNLCIRLGGTPARLEELVGAADPERILRKPGPGWSAQENAGHLLDLEPLWLARVEEFEHGLAILSAADLANRATHEAGHNARPLPEILRSFRTARLRLVDSVESLPVEAGERTSLHPRLRQPMRLVDLLYFVAEHDDHHLARIQELIRTSAVRTGAT